MKNKFYILLFMAATIGLKSQDFASKNNIISVEKGLVSTIGRAQSSSKKISIYKVITSPEKYSGIKVRIVGFFKRDGGQAYLFPTSEQAGTLDTASAIGLSGRLNTGELFGSEFDGKHLIIEGTLFYETARELVFLKEVTYAGPGI